MLVFSLNETFGFFFSSSKLNQANKFAVVFQPGRQNLQLGRQSCQPDQCRCHRGRLPRQRCQFTMPSRKPIRRQLNRNTIAAVSRTFSASRHRSLRTFLSRLQPEVSLASSTRPRSLPAKTSRSCSSSRARPTALSILKASIRSLNQRRLGRTALRRKKLPQPLRPRRRRRRSLRRLTSRFRSRSCLQDKRRPTAEATRLRALRQSFHRHQNEHHHLRYPAGHPQAHLLGHLQARPLDHHQLYQAGHLVVRRRRFQSDNCIEKHSALDSLVRVWKILSTVAAAASHF